MLNPFEKSAPGKYNVEHTLPKLRILYLENNQITNVSLSGLKKLTNLYLDNNKIKFLWLEKIFLLSINYNQIIFIFNKSDIVWNNYSLIYNKDI